MTNEEAREQIQQQEKQRRQLEACAFSRIRAWPRELQIDDYDFRGWARGASKNCLHAGALYEYARESRKLRCLLGLMNPKRPRQPWEIMRPGLIAGKTPEPGEIESYPAEANWLPCSFEDLDEHDAERALGGWLYCLCDLADYLADNVSFGELLRTKRDELEKTFGGLNTLSRVSREFRFFWPVSEPIKVASRSEATPITVSETIAREEDRFVRGETCSEVIAMKIRWRFTNSEIVTAMKKFVRTCRPRNEAFKPRQPKKGSRRDSVRAALDCLSAMRLASYYPKSAPTPTPGELAAWKSGASPNLKASAVELFSRVRLGGRGNHIAESNFDALINEACKAFKESFPFGEDAANAPTLAERIMMKSERISSQDKV